MSYVIPDSDDEAIVEDDDENAVVVLMTMQAKKRKVESNLQRWVKHLSVLLAEEQKKVPFLINKLLFKCQPLFHSTRKNASVLRRVRLPREDVALQR